MPRRAPFQDITNVVDSHILSKGKQAQKILGSGDHPITGTKRSINPSGISIQSTTPSAGHVTLPIDVSERKRYRDRERYLQMTTEQRAAYLQRNRTGQHKRIAAFLDKGSGHKRRRMSNGASCSSTGKETREHVVANEHEDHDSTIYVPNDCFPALEEESGQSEYMTEDDESYIFTGHGTECISSYQDPNHANCVIQDDPFDRIYRSVPSGHHVLEPVLNCTHCNAKWFQYENPTFCCMGGKVNIVTPHVPAEMRRLYTSQDPDVKYFQDNIRVNWKHVPFWILNWRSPGIRGISPPCLSRTTK